MIALDDDNAYRSSLSYILLTTVQPLKTLTRRSPVIGVSVHVAAHHLSSQHDAPNSSPKTGQQALLGSHAVRAVLPTLAWISDFVRSQRVQTVAELQQC